jgi:hypothetical protein
MLQAISGPLADRHPGVDRTVAVFLALALGFEVSVWPAVGTSGWPQLSGSYRTG